MCLGKKMSWKTYLLLNCLQVMLSFFLSFLFLFPFLCCVGAGFLLFFGVEGGELGLKEFNTQRVPNLGSHGFMGQAAGGLGLKAAKAWYIGCVVFSFHLRHIMPRWKHISSKLEWKGINKCHTKSCASGLTPEALLLFLVEKPQYQHLYTRCQLKHLI